MSTDIEFMTPDQEHLMVDLAEKAAKLIERGADPSDTILTLSKEAELTPQFVERLCHAVNVGRTLSVLKSANDRTAERPLVDPVSIIQTYLAPDKTAQVKAAEWYSSGDFRDFRSKPRNAQFAPLKKSAAAVEPKPRPRYDDVLRLSKSADQLLQSAELDVGALANVFTQKLAALIRHFDTHPSEFEVVSAKTATAPSIPHATTLLKMAYEIGRLERRGAKFGEAKAPVFSKTGAFALLEELEKAGAAVDEAVRKYQEMRSLHARFRERRSQVIEGAEKEATVWEDLAKKLPTFDSSNSERQEIGQKVDRLLFDPAGEAELKGIRALTTIHEMVTNDPILSKQDPEQVTSLYNELTAAMPELSDKPVVLRGLLRKAIQQGGVLEPFELKQIADLSKARVPFEPDTFRREQIVKQLYGKN